VAVAREPCRAARHLFVHVGDVEARHLADGLEQRHRRVRVIGVHVHAQRPVVAHHEHGVTEVLEHRPEAAGIHVLPDDGEVRAVAEARRLVLRAVQRGRRVLVLELGCGVAPECGQAAGDDHREPVGTGVDDARLAQHGELLWPALDRLLAGLEGVLEHLRQQLVLLGRACVGPQPRGVHVGEVVGHTAGHRAHGREHRALRWVAHGRVGGVRGAGEGGGHEYRVDELARSRDQLLRSAAHDLREDHAAVPARAEQRGARHGAHDLVAADVVDRLPVHRAELLGHGLQRERHVVAGVTVGDREHVEVVDLLAARLQLREGGGDDAPEADEALVRHVGFLHQSAAGLPRARRLDSLRDLACF
jgi:hypothetical protein